MNDHVVRSGMPSSEKPGSRSGKKALWRKAGAASVACAAAALGLVAQPLGGASAATVSPQLSAACSSLRDVIDIVGESDLAAARQSEGWVLVRANGWTAAVPNGDWTITASDAGADINSPTGQQDASLITWYSLDVPWTFKTLGAKFLGHFTDIHNLCQTAVARDPSGESEALEMTGVTGGQELHAVLILTMLTPTTETYVGESRYLYTPASQWSTGNAETLALIIRRAIQVPQSLTGG